jgi:DNA polymerase family A
VTSILSIDFETRSTVDLKKTGVYPYAAHPDTDVWCIAYAFDDEAPELWSPGGFVAGQGMVMNALPDRIKAHIIDGGEMRAWNAQFERIIWREIMVERYGAPVILDGQWNDTAAEAAAMALPRALGQAANVTGVSQQKDDAGYRLMLQMSKPRRIEPDGTIVWWDTPDKKAKLFAYCQQDVKTERAMYHVVRRLTPHERDIYLLDQRINDRGVLVDVPLVVMAQAVADIGIERANIVLRQLTAGAVPSVTDHKALTKWLQSQGVDTDSVAKAAVKGLLDGDDLLPAVREALETRQDAGRTSIAKLHAFLDVAGDDHRARGLLLYHAASTGRWGGKLIQPQNFPRGDVPEIESYIGLVMECAYDLIALSYHPISVVSSMLRSMLRAPDGCELVVADFSAIEARVVNWLAGQYDVVKMFRDGIDVYKHNATKLYKIAYEDVQKFPHRQVGKFQELGCGFGMGAKKAVTAAKDVYALTITPEEAKTIVDNYRATHSAVVQFWQDTEEACKAAIETPNVPFKFGDAGRLKAIKAGAYLYIVLPSGRPLVYAAPRLVMAPTPWGEMREQIEISCVSGFSRQWQRERVYGGLLVENIVQAVARDLMADAMLRAEDRGYPIILDVHDEIVAEVPEGFGSVEEFEKILCELPSWAEGCPVAAEGWRGNRYKK